MTLMENDWLNQCKRGDPTAIEQLSQKHQPDLYRLTYAILNDPDEASEAVQDTFLAALRALETFRGDSSVKTWLFSIAVNLCRTQLARRHRRARLQTLFGAFLQQPAAPLPEEKIIQAEQKTSLWQQINGLNEKHRLPLILRYYHNLPITEIAVILRLPVGTVHSRLNTARERLRAALEEEIT